MVGGFDVCNLFLCCVLVLIDDGDFKGVMNFGGKLLYILFFEEWKKVFDFKDFVIDFGLGEVVKDVVKVGDMVIMDELFLEMGDKVVFKVFDNCIVCWFGIEVVWVLGKLKYVCEIYVVFIC